MKNGKSNFKFLYIWQILKHFAGTFRQAQTLKLEGVIFYFQGIDALLKIIDSVDVKYMTLFLKIEIKS